MTYYPNTEYSIEKLKSWNKATILYADENWDIFSPPVELSGICCRRVTFDNNSVLSKLRVEYYFSDENDFVMFYMVNGSKFIPNI